MMTESTAPSATAPSAAPRPVHLLKRDLPTLFLPYLAVLALCGLATAKGLMYRLVSTSNRAELERTVTAPSPRALVTLLAIGLLLSVVVPFVRACINAAVSRTLIGSGIARRRILFFHFLHSLVHSAIAFSLMLLVVIVTCVMTGDFSGRIVIDGRTTGNLWLVPIAAAVVAYLYYIYGFFHAMLFVKFRIYTALAITAFFVLITFSEPGPGLLASVASVGTFQPSWGYLVDVLVFMGFSWLMLRSLPVRR